MAVFFLGRGNRGQLADGSDGVLLGSGCAGWQKRIRGRVWKISLLLPEGKFFKVRHMQLHLQGAMKVS